VTVIGGYLGAGKTTLVNRLLSADHGRRLAVLVNDFGEINVDVELVAAHGAETLGLTNGCICCSIGDSLGAAFDQVLALDPRPDQIVVEASGVADPTKVAAYGRGWPGCRLDAVVVLADAQTIRANAVDPFVGELVIRQLRAADLVLITKTDMTDDEETGAVLGWVAEAIGSDRAVLCCTRGLVDAGLILDIGVSDGSTECDRHPADPMGTSGFDTWVVDLSEPISRADLERALVEWPARVVRMKGVIGLADGSVVVAQRVGQRVSIEPAPPTVTGGKSLVAIAVSETPTPGLP